MITLDRAKAVAWLLGFFLVADVYLWPGSAASPRAFDVIALVGAVWLGRRLLSRGAPAAPLASLLVMACPVVVWAAIAATSGRVATLLMALRWLLAVPWGMALATAASNPATRRQLAWGMWWGLVTNIAVLAMQYANQLDLTRALGLAAHDSVLSDLEISWRYPGLHGHANASTAVASLIAPVSGWLYVTGAARAWVPAASVLLLLGAGHVTSTRSPLVIAAATVIAMLLCARRAALVLRAGIAFALLIAPFWLWLGPPGGQARWEDEGNIAVNTVERLASNRIGLGLALAHPLGVGVERSAAALEDALDLPSMHNALLQVSAVFGFPVAIWLLVPMIILVARLPRGPAAPRALESALALQTLGLFFFEEHGNNPTFIALIAWFVAAAAFSRRAAGEPAS